MLPLLQKEDRCARGYVVVAALVWGRQRFIPGEIELYEPSPWFTAVSLVTVAGAIAYVFGKPLIGRWFWRVWFWPAALVWVVLGVPEINEVWSDNQFYGWGVGVSHVLIGAVLNLQMFRYAYRAAW
jgi:hypothetical protein